MPSTTDSDRTTGSRRTASVPVAQPNEDDLTRLRFVLLRLGRRMRHDSGPEGITPTQLSALSVIGRSGSITIGDLAAIESVQPPTMSRIVAALEIDGWVERIADPTDRRVSLVRSTSKGIEELDRVRAERNAFLSDRLARLSPEELESVLLALPSLEQLLKDDD